MIIGSKMRSMLTHVAVVAMVVSACGGGGDDDGAATTGGESSDSEQSAATGSGQGSDEALRIAMPADSGGTDPVNGATGPPSNPMRGNVLEMLFRSVGTEVEPWLVESYEVSDDGLTYAMTLHADVMFHDGTPLTADAVKWSLERAADPQFAGFSTGLATAPIESIKVIDDLNFEIVVAQPTPDLEGRLSTIAGAILSPASVDKGSNSYEEYVAPVSTGAYSFVERVADERYVFERFDDYWGEAAYYATQEWIVVPEAATRESLVLGGDADVAVSPPLADLAALGENASVEVLLASTARLISINVNTQDPLFSDVRVREALNLAVDKEAIIDTIMTGTADIAASPVAQSLDPDCEAPGPFDYDPERAKELLTEADADDMSMTITTTSGRYVQDVEASNAIASYLREVGIDVTVETVDTARFFELLRVPLDSAGPSALINGSAPAYADGGFALSSFVPAGHPPAGTGTSFLDVAEINEAYDAANKLPLGTERQDAFCEVSQQVWNEVPAIFLWTQRYPVLTAGGIEGVAVDFDERLDVVGARKTG